MFIMIKKLKIDHYNNYNCLNPSVLRKQCCFLPDDLKTITVIKLLINTLFCLVVIIRVI